jgi:hypothetical protein
MSDKTPIKQRNRYTIDKLRIIIKSIETEVLESDEIYFLAQPLGSRGIPLVKWHQFKQLASDAPDVIDSITRIESMLEHRLVTGALQNKVNTTMAIFLLKNRYNYKDNKQVDTNITIQPILGGASNALDARTVIDIDS